MGFRYFVSAYRDQEGREEIGTTSVHNGSQSAIEEAQRLASMYPGVFVYVQVEMVFA